MQKSSIGKIILIVGILGLILVGVSLSFYLVQNTVPLWLKIILSIGVILCLIYAGYNWDEIRKRIISPQALGGANTSVFIIIVLAILCLVNYLGFRHHKRFDLTKSKLYTLSEQSRKLVTQLKDPLQIHVFYRQRNQMLPAVQNLLKEYAALSDKIKVQYIDPDMDPGLTEQYQARDGNSIMEYESRKETVTGYAEQDFSAALLDRKSVV